MLQPFFTPCPAPVETALRETGNDWACGRLSGSASQSAGKRGRVTLLRPRDHPSSEGPQRIVCITYFWSNQLKAKEGDAYKRRQEEKKRRKIERDRVRSQHTGHRRERRRGRGGRPGARLSPNTARTKRRSVKQKEPKIKRKKKNQEKHSQQVA